MKKEDNGVKIGENTAREKDDEKEKDILEDKKKNEGVEVEEMEEKDAREGVGRKYNEDINNEKNNIYDKEEEKDDNIR
eukprot:5539627-Ditylum_brightwellii.AAC.1